MKIEELKQGQTVYVKGIITDIEEDEILDLEIHTSENNFCVNSSDVYVSIDKPKPKMPQSMLDWVDDSREADYEFEEWFYYSNQPSVVYEWVNSENKRQSELNALALMTLIVNGPEAVTVEKEQLYTVKILGCTLFKMTSDNHTRYKLIGENETPSESKFSSYKFEADLTEKEIKEADERLWQWAEEVTE